MQSNHARTKGQLLVAGLVAVLLAAGAFLPAPQPALADGPAAAAVPHRVAAMYFHRTQRCPTCLKISAYAEEAVKGGFAGQIKTGQVTWHLIDFQDPKNKRYADYYKISGPTLVLAEVDGGKVTGWKPLPKVWTLVFKKGEFLQYVQQEIRNCLEGK